jgi:anti-sigma factor RsiW
MLCEQSRTLLFDYVDETLADSVLTEVSAHLDRCAACQADCQSIRELSAQASTWHDLTPPVWQPPPVHASPQSSGFIQVLQSWFPTVASTVALTLVISMNLQGGGNPVEVPAEGRIERQQELQTLVRLVMSEMDRRSQETEENLRYVITHQIQGQRDIDDLYQQVREISYQPPGEKM